MWTAPSKSGQIRALVTTSMTLADIAKQVGCTPALVYNAKARFGKPAKRGPGRPPKAKAAPAAPAAASLDGIRHRRGRAGQPPAWLGRWKCQRQPKAMDHEPGDRPMTTTETMPLPSATPTTGTRRSPS